MCFYPISYVSMLCTAANFVTKIRSKLSDQAIDDLCFEKGYFANEGFTYT